MRAQLRLHSSLICCDWGFPIRLQAPGFTVSQREAFHIHPIALKDYKASTTEKLSTVVEPAAVVLPTMSSMSTDTSSPPSQQEAPQDAQPAIAPAEEFISLGGDEDFIGFGAASESNDSDASSESEDELDEEEGESFHPHRITLESFRKLLSCYPTTLEQVQRRKTMLKLQPKPEKGSKRKAEKRAGSASANLRGAALLQKTDFNASELRHIREEVERMAKLDRWRYEEMPRIIAERRGLNDGNDKGEDEKKKKNVEFLKKDELITIMDWKT